jgi:LysR family tcuABC transcriptional regulator
VTPLVEEQLYLIATRHGDAPDPPKRLRLAQLKDVPLILPTGPHGLRSTLDAAFARARVTPSIVAEIDSLAMLMDAVDAGLGATVQPWAALGRFPDANRRFHLTAITDPSALRLNSLCSLSDDELPPAALAARVVLADCARSLVQDGRWVGASLSRSVMAA